MSFPTNIVCCTRQDDTKYLHKCTCPNISAGTEGTSKFIQLCGYFEFVPSDPVKRYKERRVSASASYNFTGGDCDASTGPYPFSESGSDTAFEQYTFNDNGFCVIDQSTRFWNLSGSTTTCSGTESDSVSAAAGFTFPTSVQSRGCCVGIISVGGGVSDTSTTRTSSATSSLSSSTHTITLSNEDTEEIAEERTEATVLPPTYSFSRTQLYESRGTSPSLTKRELRYFLLLRDLQPERTYTYQVGRSRRTIKVNSGSTPDEIGDWEKLNPITGTFIATKRYELIDGTLNPSITDEQFEAEGYSLIASDYGLAEGEKVVTASGTLPFDQGFEEALEDNTDEDETYIELA